MSIENKYRELLAKGFSKSDYTNYIKPLNSLLGKAAKDEDIKNLHENDYLEFKYLDLDKARNGRLIYKSELALHKQSSAYWLDFINEKLVYIRISDHWGWFGIGTPKQWKLKGGNEKSNKSQAGYLVVTEVI